MNLSITDKERLNLLKARPTHRHRVDELMQIAEDIGCDQERADTFRRMVSG